MKTSSKTPTIPLILAIILFSIACANTEQVDIQKFLQCLSERSSPLFPVYEAIHTPKNVSFLAVLNYRIQNGRFKTPETPKPLALIASKHISHIQATVICAKGNGVEVRVRSGGHDFEGLSYVSNNPFVVLDMFNFHDIEIDIASETARVQSGATLGHLYYKIASKSRVHAFPAGICPTVGAGGHISGGGYGNLMRKFGLSVDNIIDAQIVTANGSILDRKSMGEDVFWAIRGGGGASFGVIISWTLKLVRVPPTVTVFEVIKTLENNATDVVYRWQHVAPKLPKDLFIRVLPHAMNGSQEGSKKLVVSFIGQFLGNSERLLRLMNSRFPELGLKKDDCNEMPWIESAVYWAGLPIGTPTDALLEPYYTIDTYKSKSDYVKEPIPKSGLESLWKLLLEIGDKGFMVWNPYGGRMSDISESDTPFPHRAGNIFMLQHYVTWEDRTKATNQYYLNISRTMYEFMAPYVSKSPREAFLNYRDLDIGMASSSSNRTLINDNAQVYGRKYFKGNLERLMRAKKSIDPSDFFKNEQSIPLGP